MSRQIPSTKGETVKVYIRRGALHSLKESIDREYFASFNTSTIDDESQSITQKDFGLNLVFGQQVVELNNNTTELSKGSWIIHHAELFEDLSMDELRLPLKIRSRVKHRIEMMLESLPFGWKGAGWRSWDSNYDLTEMEFLGIMVVDRFNQRIEKRNQIISGIAGLVEDLYDDILSDFDPQRICLIQSEHDKYEFNYIDLNQYSFIKEESQLQLYSVKNLGDIALANWIDGSKHQTGATESKVEKQSVIMNEEFDGDDNMNQIEDIQRWNYNIHSPTEMEPIYMRNMRKYSADITSKAMLTAYLPSSRVSPTKKNGHRN